MSYINYTKTARKLHDTGWKNSYHTSDNVSMLSFGCVVSQYTKLFVKGLDMYQMLPRPYLRYIGGGPGDKLIKRMGVGLGKSSRNICLGMY